MRSCSAGVPVLLLLLSGVPLQAQNRGNDEAPRVERLVFRGVESVDRNELRASIIHEETRCRSILMRPFCWVFPNSPLFVDRHYLIAEELPRDELRMRVFLFRRGYREAEAAAEVRPRGRGVEVVFHVEEGPPTVLDGLQLRQTEEVLGERQIRRAGLPQAGEPFDLVQLDSAVANLRQMLSEQGYLDAEVRDTVEVQSGERLAHLEILIEPGRRATVGEIEIRGNEGVADRVILDAMPLREERVLRASDLVAAQRSLYESNLFHEARVSVPPQPDSAKRVEVEVREAPQRLVRLGGGFNTADFIQTEGRFTHYNWLGGGRRLDARVTVGNLLAPQLNDVGIFGGAFPDGFAADDARRFLRPTWQASLELMQPAFRASENTLGASVFAQRRSIPAIVIDRSYGANLSFTRRLAPRTPATLNYRFEVTTVEAGELYFCVNYGICDLGTISALQGEQRLSPVSLNFFADRADDPLSPATGYRARLDLEHASDVTLSSFQYNRISGEATYYFPVRSGRRHVLAGRVRSGWVRPFEAEALLHPRKRFYSGGAQSVRGYGENQLGPRILTVAPDTLLAYGAGEDCTGATIAACDPAEVPVAQLQPRPLGGRSVIEGNLEYRFPVWREVGMAVFVDGAIVGGPGPELLAGIGEGADPDLLAALQRGARAITPGFGVRYASPVGAIRADLGIRPTIAGDLPVLTEIVENDQRRLVLLGTARDYDPLADADAWYWQILYRLQLHLSIGQAF